MEFPEHFFEDEVRNGFYVPAMMKRCWAASLEMLELIAGICERHGIRWFIRYGTLLGAVREHGFVPWDDDIDIGMLRGDYDRFLEAASKELPDWCLLGNVQRCPSFNDMLSNVSNRPALPLSEEMLVRFHGFPYLTNVDIFPIDAVSDDPEEEENRKAYARTLAALSNLLNDPAADFHVKQREVMAFEQHYDVKFRSGETIYHQLYRMMDDVAAEFKHRDTKRAAACYQWLYNDTHVYDRSWVDSTVELEFEGHRLPAPAGFDEILKAHYGKNYRMPVRGTSSHDYPCYRADEERILAAGVTLPDRYEFDPADLRQPEDAGGQDDSNEQKKIAEEVLRAPAEDNSAAGIFCIPLNGNSSSDALNDPAGGNSEAEAVSRSAREDSAAESRSRAHGRNYAVRTAGVRQKAQTSLEALRKMQGLLRQVLTAGDAGSLLPMLEQLQGAAVRAGNLIEELSPEGTKVSGRLSEYCELLYKMYLVLTGAEIAGRQGAPDAADGKRPETAATAEGQAEEQEESAAGGTEQDLREKLRSLADRMERTLSEAKALVPELTAFHEAVFLPFRADAWSEMAPLWEKLCADPSWRVHVVPIPYSTRGPLWETDQIWYNPQDYPAELAAEDFNPYLERFGREAGETQDADRLNAGIGQEQAAGAKKQQIQTPVPGEVLPDVIVTQFPYDGYNCGMAIPNGFYAPVLQRCCDRLVYIPWLRMEDADCDDPFYGTAMINLRNFVDMPGVVCADQVLVPSGALRKTYIRLLTDFAGEEYRSHWEQAVRVIGNGNCGVSAMPAAAPVPEP